jgi:hypothetical protein
LTTWASRAIDLIEPIVDAQHRHLLQSRVLAMDETPIKAGREKKGKMRQAYFWPMYGEADEIVFHYAPSREHRHVETWLGEFRGTLLSDGYEAYAAYAKRKDGVTHAECWARCRRGFEQASARSTATSKSFASENSPVRGSSPIAPSTASRAFTPSGPGAIGNVIDRISCLPTRLPRR